MTKEEKKTYNAFVFTLRDAVGGKKGGEENRRAAFRAAKQTWLGYVIHLDEYALAILPLMWGYSSHRP